MYILGINISHDPSCCLLKDGEIVWYSEDDRLLGEKSIENPYTNLISHYEEHQEFEVADFPHCDNIKKHTHNIDYVVFASYGAHDPIDDNIIMQSIIKKLGEERVDFTASLFFPEKHHIYHAANAFYASGFDDAVALVMDGGGAYDPKYREEVTSKKCEFPFREVETIYDCSYDTTEFKKVFQLNSMLDSLPGENGDLDNYQDFFWKRDWNEFYSRSDSAGNLFAGACNIFDMNHNDQGKVMGLSGHRIPTSGYGSYVGDDGLIDDDETFSLNETFDPSKFFMTSDWFYEKDGISLAKPLIMTTADDFICSNDIDIDLKDNTYDFYVCAEIAYKLQMETFKHTCTLIEKAINLTGKKKIVLSGGYFLNCVNNYKYTKKFPELEFFVDPIPHDAGTAIGAAKYVWYGLTKSKDKIPLKNLYTGSM